MGGQGLSPEDYTVSNTLEERVCVGIHGQDMLAVRVFFQSGVDPVHKGISLFLCKHEHLQESTKQLQYKVTVSLTVSLSIFSVK